MRNVASSEEPDEGLHAQMFPSAFVHLTSRYSSKFPATQQVPSGSQLITRPSAFVVKGATVMLTVCLKWHLLATSASLIKYQIPITVFPQLLICGKNVSLFPPSWHWENSHSGEYLRLQASKLQVDHFVNRILEGFLRSDVPPTVLTFTLTCCCPCMLERCLKTRIITVDHTNHTHTPRVCLGLSKVWELCFDLLCLWS